MSYADTGKAWSRQNFAAHVATVRKPDWVRGVTLHHTASPSLQMRPTGLTLTHIENIRDFYKDELGWSCGPHLFIDEDHIFGMTPLGEPGTHARSFNRTHVGIEVLGDYDNEEPSTGRGYQCWLTAAHAVAALLTAWGLRADDINFHRDDPKTSKTCPGKRVSKVWFRDLVTMALKTPATKPQIQHTLGTDLVPVAAYVAAVCRAETLTKTDEGTFLGEWRLETAHYDKVQQTTLAARGELERWVNQTTKGGTA